MEMKDDSERFRHSIALESLEDTAHLGALIARALKKGNTLALRGDLGAGKTALARSILQALGVTGPIASPTFTLVQAYETARLPIRHFDLYRIEDPSELEELGLDEALSEGAALIEWPDRAEMPEDAINLTLTITGAQSRQAEIDAPAAWAAIFAGKDF
ncbi:hypothetical protein GCM10008941_20010 [Rhizomicrobium palustre]